jgi:hypothetical protein
MTSIWTLTDRSLPHQIQLVVHHSHWLRITCNCHGFETEVAWGRPVAEYVRIYNEGAHHDTNPGTADSPCGHRR